MLEIIFEVQNAEKLLAEAAAAAGAQRGAFFHGKKAVNAERDYRNAHHQEQPHIVAVAAHEHAAHHGAHDGADYWLCGQRRAQLAAVLVCHVVVDPRVQANVVAHRAEKAHYGVCRHHRDAHGRQQLGIVLQLARDKVLRQPKHNGKNTPQDIAQRNKAFALADAV